MQRSALFAQFIYTFFGGWIFDQRRSVMRFDARVDNKWAAAAPVFMFGKGVYAVDIMAWIAAGKGYPNKIVNVFGCKTGVVAQNHQW